MRIFKALVGISLLCLVAGDEQIVPGTANKNAPPPPPPPNPTTSTTVKPTSPTSKPTVSTHPPDTTTTTTTTTAKPTTTTTAKPTTTTTKTSTAPTTAKPTTPSPVDPVQGKWVSNYKNTNRTCLVLEAAIQIDIPYKDGNNVSKVFKVNVPPTAKAAGDCGADQEVITLFFVDPNNTISFKFNKTTDTKKFDLNSIMVTLNFTIPERNISQLVILGHNKQEFDTPLSNSYKCAKEQTLNLTGSFPVEQGLLRISHLQVQAFRNSTNANFDEALDCAGSETPDVVPIAVGCALAALVIIVLVAYLIGRRRSQARGYLSMFAQNKREEDYIPMKNLSCFN